MTLIFFGQEDKLTIRGKVEAAPYETIIKDSSNIYNVVSYGAVADHSTDNTAAFQAAIDACAAAGGGQVYVPAAANYYDIDGALSIQTDNIRIYGDGMYSSKLYFTDGNPDDVGFWFTKSGDTQLNNSGLEDLQIWIDDYDLIAARFTVTIWGYVRRCNIRNISGLTDNSTAVSFKGKTNLGWSGGNIIDRCEISDVHTGVYIDSISNNNFIINSWISGNANKFTGSSCIKIVDGGDQSDSQFISGCNFENVEKGILVDAVAARILGCRFEGVDTAIHVAQINAQLTTASNVYSDVSEKVYSVGGYSQRYVTMLESAKLELSGVSSTQPEIKLGTSSGTEAGSMVFMNANESHTESALELRAYGSDSVADEFGGAETQTRGVISSDFDLKVGTTDANDFKLYTNSIERLIIDAAGDVSIGGVIQSPSLDSIREQYLGGIFVVDHPGDSTALMDELQTAINAAYDAGSGTAYVKAGTYRWNTAPDTLKGNTYQRANILFDKGARIWVDSGYSGSIFVKEPDKELRGVTVEGGTWSGAGGQHSWDFMDLVSTTVSTQVVGNTFRNMRFRAVNNAFTFTAFGTGWVNANVIDNVYCGSPAKFLYINNTSSTPGSANGNLVSNVNVQNNTWTTHGIHLIKGQTNQFTNINLWDFHTPQRTVLFDENSSYNNISGIIWPDSLAIDEGTNNIMWHGNKLISGDIVFQGETSGETTLKAADEAGAGTVTLPTSGTLATDEVIKGDTASRFSFEEGNGLSGAQASFNIGGIIGAEYYPGPDTLGITEVRGIVMEDSGTVTSDIGLYYDVNLGDPTPTSILSDDATIDNTTTGNVFTHNTSPTIEQPMIPPGVWVWAEVEGKSTGNMPTYMNLKLSGNRLNPYLGEDLVDQSAWYTIAYWPAGTPGANWSQSGSTLVSDGNSGYLTNWNFWTVGVTYEITFTVTVNSGTFRGPYDGSESSQLITTSGTYTYEKIPTVIGCYMHSNSFDGVITALSVREVL